jgi:hypothetical protein
LHLNRLFAFGLKIEPTHRFIQHWKQLCTAHSKHR